MSILFVVGKYAGFRFENGRKFYRFVIGFVAIWILFRDFETLFYNVVEASEVIGE